MSRERTLAIAWAVVAVAFVLLLGYEITRYFGLRTEGQKAQAQRQQLTQQIRVTEEQIVAEMRANTQLLQEMQWTSSGGDPAAFLNRVADLVREKRLRVLGIGSLERQATPQFNKSWHSMQLVAPYRELREIAARVESEKGILEEMRIDLPQAAAGGPGVATPRDELQAKFKMTALELTAEAKQVMERALAASGGTAPGAPSGTLALPVPTTVAQAPPSGRDPFHFPAPPPAPPAARRPARPAGAAPSGEPEKPKEVVPMEVSGIVGFPGGFLAILNNQIVKVGDQVSGHRVERITDREVVLRTPDGGPRSVPLKDLTTAPAAAPRR